MREEKYKAAIESHRHYDTLSITAIAGMFAVTYGCYNLHKELHNILNTNAIFFIGAVAIIFFYCLYYKLSNFALIARNVSRMLEKEDGFGVSEVYYISTQKDEDSIKKFAPYERKKISGLSFPVRCFVFFIAAGQIITLLITAVSLIVNK
jgi:hypothetical protein